MFPSCKKSNLPGISLATVTIWGIIITAIVYLFSQGISGNDFWWHIKVGEWVVSNKSVPTTDIFSWYGTAHEIPWTAHEWLADVMLYAIHNVFGNIGIFLLSMSAAFLMTWLLWREAKPYIERNIFITGLFFVLLAITTYGFFYGRPHLFSFFLVFAELKILYRFFKDPNSKSIYLIPVISCLWSNLHGGFASLSYILCAVFLFAGMWNIPIGKISPTKLEKKALLKLLVITLCSIGAILINPVGIDVLTYPYKSFGDQLQMTFINEWQAPDAKNIFNLICFFFPIVLMLIGFFAEEKRIRLIDLLVMGLFVLLFLRSIRFIMVWYIAAVFCAFPYMPQMKVKDMCPKFERTLIVTFLLVFSLLIGDGCIKISKTLQNDELISVMLSDEAISAIQEDASERVFNDYNLGEALIYNEIPVFFDARADLYVENGILADGISLMDLVQVNPDAEVPYIDVYELIKKYEFDSILILKEMPLYSYLISHPDLFVSVYEDNSIGYFRIAG